ncbi:MAG: multicopper oxidase family protein [Burkholderiales bacterium]|nr:multicopper oxidase family protein [Burkholderiales bacterium]
MPDAVKDRVASPSSGRRRFLAGAVGLAAAPLVWLRGAAQAGAEPRLVEATLAPAPAKVRLVPEQYAATAVWAYNAAVPGPTLRVRQGDRLRVRLENGLDEGTTVHWHGIRLPNAMDGVPDLTQPLVAPGQSFQYEFVVPDAGTYWYHPHQRSYEQIGRGLSGALIVEEREPIRVDRDVLWVLGDWRLERDASIRGGFGNFMDLSHNGRVGNTVTINGHVPESFPVRAGERIRLRLVNAASARIFGLRFQGHEPRIVALDGQPVEPHAPEGGVFVLAPAQRADLVIDMVGDPGSRHEVHDGFYRNLEYRLIEIAYAAEPPLRARPLDAPIRLPTNPLAEPDLARAERHDLVLTGGMMGNMRGLPRGMAWAVNGTANSCGSGKVIDPLFILRRGRSCVLRLVNETQWHHPMHLHGHAFRVISRDARPTRYREWLDTVLLAPRETAEIAFVADNPGDWLLHCHVLEHQASGMTVCLRVA